jgi:phage tail sheath protein FI
MSYLHGVETISVDIAGQTFQVVKSGVIGIVGIAPTGPLNQLVLVNSDADFSQFGLSVPGFTIPQTLEVIKLQGAATAFVINVFDPATHVTAVTLESKTVANGKLKLGFAPIGTVNVFDSAGVASTYILGTDYTIDAYGNFKVINPAITNATVLKFTYNKLNLSAITATVVNGANTSGVRTGTALWELAYQTYGFNPKILIAPGFSTVSAVASNLRALADKYRAIDYTDAPAGTIVDDAIAGRGPAGSIANFNIAHQRTELVFPQLKKYDTASNANVSFPYSAYLAGIRQAVDNDQANGGFWVSTSNKAINCEGVELAISASLNDSTSDNQLLNAAGITTVFNTYGTGIRTWGNRNSTFPGVAGPKTFTNMIRIDDIVSESMELASLPYVDLGITQAFIDVVREAGNSFIRTLIQRGALLPGSKVIYSQADNSADELANGHIVFERIYMGSTPAERITYKSVMDITLLQNLK